MSEPFRAFVVNQIPEGFQAGMRRLELSDLPPGDVLIRVTYAGVNYKDALACTPNGGIARIAPLIPGLEGTGVVVESADARFAPGDTVCVSDAGKTLGVARHGCFSEYVRVPAAFVTRIPIEVSAKHYLVLQAGLTAAMSLRELRKNGLAPEQGPVLVTGATGGVGSLAVALLARSGYTVAASTGKADAHDLLRQLGASEILSREETSAASARPLDHERWAGSIDTVGGATMAYLLRTTRKGGGIAAVGVAGGAAFQATVYPLILRGVKVLGIDMPSTEAAVRAELWADVLRAAPAMSLVDALASEVTLDDIPRVTQAMLAGQTRGRTLVRIRAE